MFILLHDLNNYKKYKAVLFVVSIALLFCGFVSRNKSLVGENKALVQIALVVDFSHSAKVAGEGLLNHYWDVYNQFHAKYPNKKLELAFVAFSLEDFGKLNHYVQVLTSFDTNADEAFKIILEKRVGKSTHTNNVVAAIGAAVDKLNWQTSARERKIVVVGNGPITSGKAFAKRVFRKASYMGLSFDYLYLLRKQDDKNYGYWSTLAKMSGGGIKTVIPQFLSGFHDRSKGDALQSIINEQELLMGSYVQNGDEEIEALKKIAWIDDFALNLSREAFASRIAFKTTPYFQHVNIKWDEVGKAIAAKSSTGQLKNTSSLLKEKISQRCESISVIQSFYKNWTEIIIQPNLVPAYKYGFSTTIINLLK